MATVVRIHAYATEPCGFVTGRDVVLDRWAPSDLPDRVLLDDWLSSEDRKQIDREARAMLEDFAAHSGDSLRCGGLDLIHAWWWELLSEVFLWELRIARGLERAIAELEPNGIEWFGVDPERRQILEAILGRQGRVRGAAPDGPVYPSSFGTGQRHSMRSRLVRSAALAVGMPTLVRGNVLISAYGGMQSLFSPATTRGTYTAVLNPRSLPAPPWSELARLAIRGGWLGTPMPIGRLSARRQLHRCLSRLEERLGDDPGSLPLQKLAERRAIELLHQLAATTVADFGVARRALAAHQLRALVLPFDAPPYERTLVQAARSAGVPTLVVQHGFVTAPDVLPAATEADVIAVWSQADAEALRPYARGRVTVTGNPGVEHRLGQPSPVARTRTHTVVLVEYPFRPSVRVDSRVKHEHVVNALRSLVRTRPGTDVVLRPHPADHEPQALEWAVAAFPEIRVTIDCSSPFTTLLDGCDLLVGALSTAALEAGARGIPVIFLNSLGVHANPPFDGSGGLPTARGLDDLVELILSVMAAREPSAQETMRAALGMMPGSTAAVVGEIERLVTG